MLIDIEIFKLKGKTINGIDVDSSFSYPNPGLTEMKLFIENIGCYIISSEIGNGETFTVEEDTENGIWYFYIINKFYKPHICSDRYGDEKFLTIEWVKTDHGFYVKSVTFDFIKEDE